MQSEIHIEKAYSGSNSEVRVFVPYTGNLTKTKEESIRLKLISLGYRPCGKASNIVIQPRVEGCETIHHLDFTK